MDIQRHKASPASLALPISLLIVVIAFAAMTRNLISIASAEELTIEQVSPLAEREYTADDLALLLQASNMKDTKTLPGRALRNGNNRREEWLTSNRTVLPQTSRAEAVLLLKDYGWDLDEWPALDRLWWHESNWGHKHGSTEEGAFGIPQANPGEKMARTGDDWQTNPITQIRWGMKYIQERYGSPTNAWKQWTKRAASGKHGWY